MTSPFGPVCPAAAVPMAPKMPAPITAPMASMMRSPAPNTRFSACGPVESGCSSAIGLRANSCDMWRWLVVSGWWLVEPVSRFVGRDDELAARPERDANERRTRDDRRERPIGLETMQPAGTGERVHDIQLAVGTKRNPLRPSE